MEGYAHRSADERPQGRRGGWALALSLLCAVVACVLPGSEPGPIQSWWAERGPVVPHDGFPGDCSLCHAGSGWNEIRDDFTFDHLALTGVALEGAHSQAQCLRCHNDRGPVSLYSARGCAGCHEDPHRRQLGSSCVDCHNQSNWRPEGQVAEHLNTRFPLIGRHAAAACWRCHPNAQAGNFTRTPTTCVECHRDALAMATNPDHVAQGWVANCNRCHIPTGWSGAAFNHVWPLTGAHRTAQCSACHQGGVFAGTPTACVDCHLSEYQGANDPDHVALNFPTNCEQCHNTSNWGDATFNHAGITSGCAACHTDDYLGAKDPDHVAQNFSMSCEQCHNTSNWNDANFNHAGISSGCAACHTDDYLGTNNPNHLAAGFPATCELCHSTVAWQPANFSHSFPIKSGAHKDFACGQCHLNPLNFQNFSCINCHKHSQSLMDKKHSRVGGYAWVSSACYSCHPNGKSP